MINVGKIEAPKVQPEKHRGWQIVWRFFVLRIMPSETTDKRNNHKDIIQNQISYDKNISQILGIYFIM